jgi:hypothetical protein
MITKKDIDNLIEVIEFCLSCKDDIELYKRGKKLNVLFEKLKGGTKKNGN